MSDETPTQTGELGTMPEPAIEPGEENPGGVDALPDDAANIPADLDPDHNPAVDETPDPLKEAVSGSEDTDTEATKGGGDVAPEDESPA